MAYTAPTVQGTNYLRVGSSGTSVKSLQNALIALGYDVGSSGADGIFGQKTASALSAFQKKSGLSADSIYGQQSASALQKALNAISTPALAKPTGGTASLKTPPATTTAPVKAYTDTGTGGAKTPAPAKPAATPPKTPTPVATPSFAGSTAAVTSSPAKVTTPTPKPTPAPVVTPPVTPPAVKTPAPVVTPPVTPPAVVNKPAPVVNTPPPMPAAGQPPKPVPPPMPAQGTPPPAVITPKPAAEEAKEIADVEKQKVNTQPALPGSTGGTSTGTTSGGTKINTGTVIPETPNLNTGKPGTEVSNAPTPEQIQVQNMIQELTDMLNQENKYMTELTELRFDYNPATDANFLRDAATLENTVTQMMVGRGGMYSSVSQSALQSRLASLQLDYTKMKYDEYKDERAYKMDLAQMENSRRNTYFNQVMDLSNFGMKQEQWQLEQEKWRVEQDQLAWENSWKQIQYENELADRALNKQWAIEDRNRAISDAAAQKQMQMASAELSQNMANAQSKFTEFIFQKKSFDTAIQKWSRQKVADTEIVRAMARVGITIPINASFGDYTSKINQGYQILDTMQEDIQGALYSLNMDAEYLDMINDVLYPAPVQTGTKKVKIFDKDGTTVIGEEEVPIYEETVQDRNMFTSPTAANVRSSKNTRMAQ